MGRELKRVPLDFHWAIDQIWKGFVNPYNSIKCKSCDGTGLNPATKKLSDDWYAFDKFDWIYPNGEHGRRWNNAAWCNHITDVEVEALLKGGRLSDLMDSWYRYDEETDKWMVLKNRHKGWKECERPQIPKAEKVNEWSRIGMGHDAINKSICVEARAKHLGVWGDCEFCEGLGEIWQSDEIRKLSEEWEEFEPPTGEGFQLWSTTTEGHPMTPVFKTLEELCGYCEKENISVFGYNGATKEEWLKMLDDGFVSHQEGDMIFI